MRPDSDRIECFGVFYSCAELKASKVLPVFFQVDTYESSSQFHRSISATSFSKSKSALATQLVYPPHYDTSERPSCVRTGCSRPFRLLVHLRKTNILMQAGTTSLCLAEPATPGTLLKPPGHPLPTVPPFLAQTLASKPPGRSEIFL